MTITTTSKSQLIFNNYQRYLKVSPCKLISASFGLKEILKDKCDILYGLYIYMN